MAELQILINAKNQASAALATVKKDLDGIGQSGSSVGEMLKSVGSTLTGVGAGLTAGVTLPLVGIGTAAISASTELNKMMGNIQSLGLSQERVIELKGAVQDLAVQMGKDTGDMADGLYQVISTFGDSADAVNSLEIAAKAGAAGLATTTDAINLISAVTKGYGDTSLVTQQKVSDLAFQTVNLGQTTFPELASAIGKAVPLAAGLGVSMEEMFGVLATGSGVTGTTSEVTTQLRGVMQSLLAPTKDMSTLLDDLGFSSGEAMIKQLGLQKTIETIVGAAESSGVPLQKYIGSIEGQTLAMALAGPMAQDFTNKLSSMGNVAGVTDAAFKAQTEGINAAGFTMDQLRSKVQVLLERLGDGLAPSLAKVLDAITPLLDKVAQAVNWFANADASTQQWIVGIAAAVAAIGPLLVILGTMISTIGTVISVVSSVGSALGLLTNPIGWVVLAIGALVLAWETDFMGIREKTAAAATWIGEKFTAIVASIESATKPLSDLWDWIVKLTSGDLTLVAAAPEWITTLMAWLWPIFISQPEWAKKLVDWLWPDFIHQPAWVKTLVDWLWPGFIGQPGWVSTLVAWVWPGFIGQPNWVGDLFNWDWPDFISMPGWLNDLLNWQWPSMPSWLGGNAQGTTNFAGGLTMVGENGPEIVALPASSRIYTNRESQRLASSGVGAGGGFSIVIQNAYMRSDRDVTQLAYEIDDILKRRRSGGWR